METKFIFNRKNKLVRGEGLIDIQLYLSRSKRPIKSTEIRILPKYWDEQKGYVKRTHPNFSFIDDQLTEIKTRIERIVLQQKINGERIDITNPKQRDIKFFDFFENEVMKVSNTGLTDGTNLIYKRTLKYLREFSNEINIDQLNVSFLERFNKFLIDEKKLSINTRVSHFRKVKRAVNMAVAKDYIPFSANPFKKGFSIKEVAPPNKALTLVELRKIENLDMSQRPELLKTQKMFLFCCYTSIRYGDLCELTAKNFEVLENGKIRLSYVPSKTSRINGKVVKWIISDFWNGAAHEIVKNELDHLNTFEGHETEDIAFFYYTNEFYNRQLKELQRYAKIKTVLTSHLARHTCITLLVNDFEMDITKVQLIAGHSKIEMTQKYLRITERDLAESASRVDWNK